MQVIRIQSISPALGRVPELRLMSARRTSQLTGTAETVVLLTVQLINNTRGSLMQIWSGDDETGVVQVGSRSYAFASYRFEY